MLPLCQDQGVGVIPWSPLARGKLTREWAARTARSQTDPFAALTHAATEQPDRAVAEAVRRIADERGVSRAQVALAWVLAKSAVTSPIIGATKPAHLADAVAALDIELSEAEIADLEAPYVPHPVHAMVPPNGATRPGLTQPD